MPLPTTAAPGISDGSKLGIGIASVASDAAVADSATTAALDDGGPSVAMPAAEAERATGPAAIPAA
jgi:hypothetical protein